MPAGLAGVDGFVLGIFAWADATFASIYLGMAERAVELAVAGTKKKTSVALGGRSMAYNPMVQYSIAEMGIELESITAQVERVAADWSEGVDYGMAWPIKLFAAKYKAVEGAKRIVDIAMDVSGGTGMFKSNELERMYRDVRCGGFHPANSKRRSRSHRQGASRRTRRDAALVKSGQRTAGPPVLHSAGRAGRDSSDVRLGSTSRRRLRGGPQSG
ncbi:MAG: acyl-CoA dehydrogenase family protein [Acidimicrobiales bacterium]